MPISPNELLQSLRTRYATKVFDPEKKIDSETWQAIEESLVLTPSSFGLQPWKFIIVENPEIREQLKAASWGQGQVTDASHFIVFTIRTDLTAADVSSWLSRLSEVQGTSLEKLNGLGDVINSFTGNMAVADKDAWNARQAYIALGQLMTSVSLLGLDSCPLEGISPTDYDKILKLDSTGYRAVVGCAVGYRSSEDKYASAPKARFDKSKMIERV